MNLQCKGFFVTNLLPKLPTGNRQLANTLYENGRSGLLLIACCLFSDVGQSYRFTVIWLKGKIFRRIANGSIGTAQIFYPAFAG
jgi:hypothetical protein